MLTLPVPGIGYGLGSRAGIRISPLAIRLNVHVYVLVMGLGVPVRIVVGGPELLGVARDIIGRYMYGFRYAEAAVRDGWARIAVARANGEVVGAEVFYWLSARPYRICVHYYIATAAEWRRRGVARALITRVEDVCEGHFHLATTWRDNSAAIGLFTSLGYSAVPWEALSRDLADVLLRATCGYDDDVLLVKSSIQLSALLSADTSEISKFHRRECYAVWRAMRGTL